jgi:hypothetical protein
LGLSCSYTWLFFSKKVYNKFGCCYFHGFEVRSVYILNVGITWISWGVAPGYINIAPLGLSCSYTWLFFSKKVQFVPLLSILESTTSFRSQRFKPCRLGKQAQGMSVVENNAKNNCLPLVGRFIVSDSSPLVGRFIVGDCSPLVGQFIVGDCSPLVGQFVVGDCSP